MIPKFLLKENIVAPEGFNRWRVPPASIAIHFCIGSVYAWSKFTGPLTRELGVVSSAADDWTLGQVTWIFSVAIVVLGLTAALGGKWLERVGPRAVGVTSAICWGGGFIIGSLGLLMHQLWLIYLGYGVLGGCGLGLGYVSPVSTLIRWFPDRRGMATGMAIMGFGGGAIIAAPLKVWLMNLYARAATSLGEVTSLELVTREGRRYVRQAGELVEVVVNEGQAYVVGSGSTGTAMTFLTLGIGYFIVMTVAAMAFRVPAKDWKPAGWEPPDQEASARKMISRAHVHIDQALKTPQFYLLWIVLCFNVTAGIGVIGVARTMVSEIFGDAISSNQGVGGFAGMVVGFASAYVMMLSVFNMIGRFIWASASDYLGRKNTYHIFLALGMVLYLSIPFIAANPTVGGLAIFCVVTMIIFTMYGGGFATIPAYLADIFGSRFVGGIHGRLLTAWSTAGVLGPLAITSLRQRAVDNAVNDLVSKVDPGEFAQAFGAPLDQLEELREAKTVTIQSLMEIVPPGTVDPTPTLYNSTMYVMAALLLIAFFANLMVKPVSEKHHMNSEA